MSYEYRPLVLVHGLWDEPNIFNSLIKNLDQPNLPLLIPHLPHDFGRRSLRDLAGELDRYIYESYGDELSIDLLGFSMGGVIGRLWLQNFGGALRTDRFLSVGSPHNGTLTAQAFPDWLFHGVSEMKVGSPLLRELNSDLTALKNVSCSSFFCRWDLMVFPGWKAVLPVGSSYAIPVLTHKGLVSHPKALNVLKRILLSHS